MAILGFCIYSNTFHSEFVLDDKPYIVHNPAVKNFDYFLEPSKVLELDVISPNFRYAFITRIVGYFTFALNYHMHGLDVTGYHVFNLLVHIVNGLLIYFLVRLIFNTPFVSNSVADPDSSTMAPADLFALFSALIFVSHPVQTQAVTYITQRFASLAALFFLLSVVAYVKSRLSITMTLRYGLYGVSLVSAALAMLVKEIAFTLPVVILLTELTFFYGNLRKKAALLFPFALTMLIIPSSLLLAGGSTNIGAIGHSMKTLAAHPAVSRWDYLITQFSVTARYIRLMFLPVNQNADYDYPVYHSISDPVVLSSLLFLLIILSLGMFFFIQSRRTSIKRGPGLGLISFGISWFFITLSVESSIIPIDDVIFEHRLYLPSAGFIIAVIAALSMAVSTVKSRTSVKVFAASALVVVLVLSGTAYSRNFVWKDNITFWKDAAEKSPLKDRPHFNLGVAYTVKDRTGDAIKEYLAAIRVNPGHVKAHNNLGLAYAARGRIGDAVKEYLEAIRTDPDYAEAHYNLGLAYDSMGRTEEAVGEYLTAVRIDPDYFEAHINLGVAYYKLGRSEDAVKGYLTAIRINPGFAVAHYNLGLAYDSLGRTPEAVKAYRTAVRIKPDFQEARYRLGIMYGKTY